MNEKDPGNEPTRITLGNTYTESALGNIEPYDSRIAHIWQRAGEIATERGYCAEFDSMMMALGTGYRRTRIYNVSVVTNVTLTIPITCTGIKDPVNMLSDEDIKAHFPEDAVVTDWAISEIVPERYEP